MLTHLFIQERRVQPLRLRSVKLRCWSSLPHLDSDFSSSQVPQLPTSSSKWVGEPDYMYVELEMLPVRRAAEEVINEEGMVGYEV